MILFFISFTAFSQTVSKKTSPIIIVGAGIAGLSAANYLQAHHMPVLILEARNRIGGRIDTVQYQNATFDLGAAWLHGIKHNPLTKLINQQHIQIIPTYYNDNLPFDVFHSFTFYDDQGQKITKNEMRNVVQLAKKCDEFITHQKQKNIFSVKEALDRFIYLHHLPSRVAHLLHFIMINIYTYEFAGDLQSLSADANSPYLQSKVSGKNYLFPQGYAQVLTKLAENIPINLNEKVRAIRYEKKGVEVVTDKTHYQADFVILTVPLGVLKANTIHFKPTLPKAKQMAIKQLQMGIYNKIYLFFDKPFWNKKVEWLGYIPTEKNINNSLDIMNFYPLSHLPILVVFTGGSLAKKMEYWDNQKIITNIMQPLQTIYGQRISQPTAYVITRWYQDPFSGGSYSYLPKGVDKNTYAVMARPVAQRLFFAGEATSKTDPSTVHGAYVTGIRAAKEVLSVLAKS